MANNNQLNHTQLEQVADDLLQLAKKKGASAAEVSTSTELGFSVNVRMGDIETIEHHQQKGISISVYFGHKTGSANTSDLSAAALQDTVEKACNIARFTSEDEYAGLADKDLMAFDYPSLDLYHPWRIDANHAATLAIECENIARNVDKRIINSEGVSLSNFEHFSVYANSHGFSGSYATTRHSISCALIASDGHQMQRDYEYTVARDATDLVAVGNVAKNAANNTVQRLGARKLSTRRAPIVFVAEVARNLLGNFISAISGGNLYRKSSFLLDHLHKSVFASHIQIDERPHLSKAIGSAPFDSEGVRTQPRYLVQEGILQGYVLGSYSARKLGMQTTGNANGVHNLFINHSDDNLEQLLKRMDTGLFVTELFGQGVNMVTGDYSRGVFGYWIENGEIQYPVHEITIAGNLRDMFQNLVAVANDVDNRGNIHTGSILIENMTIAGD